MKKQIWVQTVSLLAGLVLLATLAGCGANTATPNETQAPATEEHQMSATEASVTSEATAQPQPAADPNILYQDDFKNPQTGWASETFDNYFIGYHEPEYYHVAITSPNYKTTVFIPEKPVFTDTTIEVSAFTFAGKTAETGDFRYGVVFRRQGDDYYAFAISQRTKSWAVLKSTPSQFVTLKEGTSEAINDFDIADLLRVDIKGSSFFFHINNQFVTQVDDADYPSGEVGFFVQTLDAPNLHIHYDSLTVREFEPRLICTITALRLNIRFGPGTNFENGDFLVQNTIVEPVGRDSDSKWLKIRTADASKQGWIANIPEFVSCNAALDVLPVISP